MPFPHVTISAQKPLNPEYPVDPQTIGEHIRKKRMDLGLWQKDVAKMIGTNTSTITNWELGHAEPLIRYIPAIIGFLGYIPFEIGDSLSEKLRAYRKIRGLSRKRASLEIGVDEGTWWKWEKEIVTPRFFRVKQKIEKLMLWLDEAQKNY